MLPQRTKSCHLGMSRQGAAGSGEARSWRDVVRSRTGAILNNWVHSSLVIYPTELEKRHCHHLLVPWAARLSDDSIGELSWSFARHLVGAAFSAITNLWDLYELLLQGQWVCQCYSSQILISVIWGEITVCRQWWGKWLPLAGLVSDASES